MKLNIRHYYQLIFLLFISNLTFSMDKPCFQVNNTEENKLIAQTSSMIAPFLEEIDHRDITISLPLITHPKTWECMKLLYTSSSEESVLKQLKELKKDELIYVLNNAHPLDIEHKNINLFNLSSITLTQRLDPKTDKKLISLISPEIQKELTCNLLEEIFAYSYKIIRPSHSCHGDGGSYQSFTQRGNIGIGRNENDGIICNLKEYKITRLSGHLEKVCSVEISIDGKLGFTGAKDNTVKIWETETGTCLHTLSYNSISKIMACNNTTTQLVCGYEDGTVKIWNIADGSCSHTFLPVTSGYITSVAFNHDGSEIITTNIYSAKIYSTQTGECKKTINSNASIFAVAFNHDGTKAIIGLDREALLWDIAKDQCIRTFSLPEKIMRLHPRPSYINSITLTNDGNTLYTKFHYYEAPTIAWDINTGKYLGTIHPGLQECGDLPIGMPSFHLSHEALKKWIYDDTIIDLQKKESLSLLRILWIYNIYTNYTKNNKKYSLPYPNYDKEIFDTMPFNAEKHLKTIFFIKYDKPWFVKIIAFVLKNKFNILVPAMIACISTYYLRSLLFTKL